ncbi:NlpC/P60 family protein [soil metagenome]
MHARSPHDHPNFRARRLALGVALLIFRGVAALAVTQGAPAQDSAAELEGKMDELQSNVDQQGDLQSTIDAQNERINSVIAAESELRRKADAVQADLDERQADLDAATKKLNAQKAHLAEIRARLERAMAALEDLLVQMYKTNDPDLLGVVLNSDSWDEVVSETDYLNRIQEYDEAVVERVSGLREEIETTVAELRDVQERIKVARDEVVSRRAELSKAQAEIADQHSQLVAMRSERQASLAALQSQEKSLEKDLGTSIPGPGERAALINGEAVAPAGAPLVVKAVIDAANQINDKPYVWGGGHGSFDDSGYDCSGAVSYALHGGGLIDSPLDSSGFLAWGSPGAGSWITIYTYSGHMYMVVAGLRFDTGGTGGGNGPRWSSVMRETSGFSPRHPDGF